jgi:type I restriction enzyme M protein
VVIGEINQSTFDLSVKNPNRGEEVKHRSPRAIMAEIARPASESEKVLAKIKALL